MKYGMLVCQSPIKTDSCHFYRKADFLTERTTEQLTDIQKIVGWMDG